MAPRAGTCARTQPGADPARAACWSAEGELDEAKDHADHLALYAPDNPNAIALFAEIDAARGDHASAVRRRKEAAEKFPQLPQLWHEYGLALIAARDFAQCEALVAKLKNSNPQGAIRLEGLLLRAKLPEAGHSAFWKQAHEAFPQNATFLRRHVLAALRDGKKDEAAQALETLFASQLLREGRYELRHRHGQSARRRPRPRYAGWCAIS